MKLETEAPTIVGHLKPQSQCSSPRPKPSSALPNRSSHAPKRSSRAQLERIPISPTLTPQPLTTKNRKFFVQLEHSDSAHLTLDPGHWTLDLDPRSSGANLALNMSAPHFQNSQPGHDLRTSSPKTFQNMSAHVGLPASIPQFAIRTPHHSAAKNFTHTAAGILTMSPNCVSFPLDRSTLKTATLSVAWLHAMTYVPVGSMPKLRGVRPPVF
jgi:hypothetical protein